MLGTGVLLFFKFLSMLIGKGILKGLYLLILFVYVIGIFEQGKEGGELVYTYGSNVEQVKTLDDKIFDLEEALEEAEEKVEPAQEENAPSEPESSPAAVETAPEEATPAPVEAVKESVEASSMQSISEQEPMEEAAVESMNETVESVKTIVEEEAIKVQRMPEEMVQPQIATH
jgi:seryl-tRNA synthetase